MKRILTTALAVAAIGSLAAPGASVAQTSPTLTLTEACQTVAGTNFYGITITVTGVPPNSLVSGSVSNGVSGTITADASGVASITFFDFSPLPWTVDITSPFSARQSLFVDCLPNTKEECMNGGWQGFLGVFKNQGDCVSFVAAKGKNPPGGGS